MLSALPVRASRVIGPTNNTALQKQRSIWHQEAAKESAMPSTFTVNRASGYEQLMGRWSRQLAVPFIEFAGLGDGERIVDVGCGTGSLTFALADAANVAEIAAVDISPVFVEEAQRRNTDPRIKIQQADACALPFKDNSFDRALSL